jgi:D-alanyl-D-alanine dipeptidase
MTAINLGEEFVELTRFPGVTIDLRYAGSNNFIGENIYLGKMEKAFLHRDAAEMFREVCENLQKKKPGWKVLVLDALRPRSVQTRMWNHVKGTSEEIYVANPERGSMHNFGLAIDLTLLDSDGREVDMGTPFDSFQELAQPRHEERFLASGALSSLQVENRVLLRTLMTDAGFSSIPHEWWHFNAIGFSEAKAKYSILE